MTHLQIYSPIYFVIYLIIGYITTILNHPFFIGYSDIEDMTMAELISTVTSIIAVTILWPIFWIIRFVYKISHISKFFIQKFLNYKPFNKKQQEML